MKLFFEALDQASSSSLSSVLSAPLFLEAGRVPVDGQAVERLISEHTEALIEEAGLDF